MFMTERFTSIDSVTDTPFPPWLFGSLLFYKGISIPAPISSSGTSGASHKFAKSLATSKPTKLSCYTFGLAHLIGGYMIYDDNLENGAGFTFAWSTLYLLVNGRASFKSVFSGRVSPLALSILALGNAGIYGKKFFWPQTSLGI